MSKDIPRITYRYFIFESRTVAKGGYLPNFDRRAHACWYYLDCAHKHLESLADGAVYEGEDDLKGNALNNIARSVAIQYRLDDPGEFFKFMGVCMQEAARTGIGIDPRVLLAGDQSFRHSI